MALLAGLALAAAAPAQAVVAVPAEQAPAKTGLPLRGLHTVLEGEQRQGPAARPAAPAAARRALSNQEAPALAGSAVAFGENYFGQLGTFYKDKYELGAVPVEGLGEIREISGSDSFDLALLADGTVASWGGNSHGQLGDGTKRPNWEHGLGHVIVRAEDPLTHEPAGFLEGVKQVAAANEHAMALLQNGTVLTWGNDEYGQLGNGTQGFERQININERLPKVVPGLPPITAIAAGGGSDYALTSQGTVLAWGNNTADQLGLGVPGPDHCETAVTGPGHGELCSERPRPVMWKNPATGLVQELGEVETVWAGQFAAYARLRNGRLVSWGANHHGELGTGSEYWVKYGFQPAEVRRANGTPLTGVAELAPGASFALARMQNGEVLGWGSAEQGALAGIPSEECHRELPQHQRSPHRAPREPRPCVQYPTPIPALEKLHPQALSAGWHFALALAAGSVYAWGSDGRGELGNGRVPPPRVSSPGVRGGNKFSSAKPSRVKGFGPAIAVDAAGTHSVVLLAGEAPPPLVAARPQPLAVRLSWQGSNSTGQEAIVGEHLYYRLSERGGEVEPAEQGNAEEEETGPPVSLAEEPPHLALLGEPLAEQEDARLVPGQRLTAEPGSWSGERPIVFSYRWERCDARGEACVPIPGVKSPGYTLTAADVGGTVRAVVTATGLQPPSTSVATETTPMIETAVEGESLRNPVTGVRLPESGLSFTIERTIEHVQIPGKGPGHYRELFSPLTATPYEVKFAASKRVRTMVLTPLAEAIRPG